MKTTKYFERRTFDFEKEKFQDAGKYQSWNACRRYDMSRTTTFEIIGLYHLSVDDYGESSTQRVFFLAADLAWLAKVTNRGAEMRNSDLDPALEVAERITGWYAFDSGPGQAFSRGPWARYVGKSKKWVCVSQYGGLDV